MFMAILRNNNIVSEEIDAVFIVILRRILTYCLSTNKLTVVHLKAKLGLIKEL